MSNETKPDVPGLHDAGATFPSWDDTQATVTVADPVSAERLPERTKVGRYRIEEVIGRGGMGVVYRARDPDLDRQVALKLLRARGRSPERAARAKQRLLREAQALAQLTHPNVVAVHDVGQVDDNVFVAMELIEGKSLRDLIRIGALTIDRTIELFIGAGRGLAAAHANDLIHRDFKPANVMVDGEGRVRVLDFGLARAQGPSSDGDTDTDSGEHDAAEAEESGSHNLLSSPLTAHGAMVGTPAYMPTEQRLGEDVDARSDQFSFCVALYEALTGQRPQVENDDPERVSRLVAKRVPRWLQSIVLRGLDENPSERFPSMDALLEDLVRGSGTWRRNLVIGVAAALTAVVVVWAMWLRASGVSNTDRCLVGAEQVDKEWSQTHRARLRAAFGKEAATHRAGTVHRVDKLLTDYAESWKDQYGKTCRAHHERGQLSADLLDASMHCLTRRLHSLSGMVAALSSDIDRAVLNEAVRAVTRMPSIAECSDVVRLRQTFPEPKDPKRRAAVRALERDLSTVDALLRAGKSTAGLARAKKLHERALELDYPPLSARTYLLQGNFALDLNQHKEADSLLKLAASTGALAGDDRTTARAWILRVRSLLLRSRYDDALAMSEAAQIAVLRAKKDNELLGQLDYSMAWLLVMKGQTKTAMVHAKRSLVSFRAAEPRDDSLVAVALIMLGNVAITLDDTATATKALTDAIQLLASSLGPGHPDIADAQHNLAHLLVQNQKFEEAFTHAKSALKIVKQTFDKKHPRRGTALWLLGQIEHKRGRLQRAQPLVERAIAIFDAHASGNPTHAALATRILAQILATRGNHHRADKLYADAKKRFQKVFGNNDPELADVLALWAGTKSALGQRRAAATLRTHAAQIRKSQPKE